MKNWGDAKRFIFEDVLVYSGLLLFTLVFDPVANLFRACGIVLFPHELDLHPLALGKTQIILALLWLVQLVRKFKDWKYYA